MCNTFALLLCLWGVSTFLATLSATHYVKATSDCLGPTVLAHAAAAVLSGVSSGCRQAKHDAAGSSQPGQSAWVMLLGLLHLLSSILTVASLQLSGAPETYIVRTLEPLYSCAFLYIMYRQKRSPLDVLLLTVVAIATACVLVGVPQPEASVPLSGLVQEASQGQVQQDTPGSGLAMPLLLALTATLAVSCRSVAGKTVAALTGVSEYQLFLQAALPGMMAGLALQAALWLVFGIQLLPSRPGGWPPSVLSALVVAALMQLAQYAASFKVLQCCSPVVHGVLNVIKRVGIILLLSVVMGRWLSGSQLACIVVANAAAVAYALRQGAAADMGKTWAVRLAPAAAHGELKLAVAPRPGCEQDSEQRHKGRCSRSWCGEAAVPTQEAMEWLAYITGMTLLLCAVLLAYVMVALHPAPQQPQQQQQQQQPQLQQGLQLLVRQPQLQWQPELGWQPQLRLGLQPSHNSSVWQLQDATKQFMVRELGRLQCLAALHQASKASLAPFLNNKADGGIALYDVALHKNLGDAVLWAAAARMVPSFHQSVKYVCAQSQFPGKGAEARRHFPKCSVKQMLKAIGPRGVVLLAPGGNWGDLWWPVHSQRLGYLKEMADTVKTANASLQVVQLPQSITFLSPNKTKADEDAINALPHGMLTLFARQQTSLQYAQRRYQSTRALPGPDLAFSLGPLMAGPPKFDVLFLMRRDKEAAAGEAPLAQGLGSKAAPTDRPAVPGATNAPGANSSSRAEASVQVALQQLDALGLSYTIREWEFAHESYTREVSKVALTQVAESRLQGAADIISLGRVVVTNRLHAAIMANLVGRPLIWIDTRHKKLSGVRVLAFSYSPSCSEANMHSIQAADFPTALQTAIKWLSSPISYGACSKSRSLMCSNRA